jgi:hypothetical protein
MLKEEGINQKRRFLCGYGGNDECGTSTVKCSCFSYMDEVVLLREDDEFVTWFGWTVNR